MSCECDPLIVGEAGPRGPQGLSGFPGTNGSSGVNAYTELTASFVQPNEFPTANNTASIAVANSTWAGAGQMIYISGAGYYILLATSSSTNMQVRLIKQDAIVPGATVTPGKKVSPSGVVSYVDPSASSLRVNQGALGSSETLSVLGTSTSTPLLLVNAALNAVSVNGNVVPGGATFSVVGSISSTGTTTASNFQGLGLSIGTGLGTVSAIRVVNISASGVSLSASVGAVARATLTVSGVALGDSVLVGYSSSPSGAFEEDVSVQAMVTSTNTVTVFFTNFSSNLYSSISVPLRLVIISSLIP